MIGDVSTSHLDAIATRGFIECLLQSVIVMVLFNRRYHTLRTECAQEIIAATEIEDFAEIRAQRKWGARAMSEPLCLPEGVFISAGGEVRPVATEGGDDVDDVCLNERAAATCWGLSGCGGDRP